VSEPTFLRLLAMPRIGWQAGLPKRRALP